VGKGVAGILLEKRWQGKSLVAVASTCLRSSPSAKAVVIGERKEKKKKGGNRHKRGQSLC